jgi:reactive intermediate/imine deaminase
MIERFNSGRVVPSQVPFPEGAAYGGLVFLSGQIGNRPGEMALVPGGLRAEARQALENIETILRGQGMGVEDLLRCTVMLADMADWPAFNEVWRDFFGIRPLPARSALGCNGLALGARVEIECIAGHGAPTVAGAPCPPGGPAGSGPAEPDPSLP